MVILPTRYRSTGKERRILTRVGVKESLYEGSIYLLGILKVARWREELGRKERPD